MSRTRKLVEEELIRVATKCFSEQGYQNTTLDDIVSQVEISRVTFYTYFESKADLLKTILERSLAAYQRGLEEIMSQSLSRPEKLRQGVAHQIISLTGEQPLIRLFFREEGNLPEDAARLVAEMHRKIDRLMEKEIQKGIERGEIINENPRLLMYAFTGMCNWLYRWYRPGGTIAPEEIIRVFTRVLESGMLAQRSRAANSAVAKNLQRVERRLQEAKKELEKVSQQLRTNGRLPRA
jgi:TetR/AcrR family transcriptional regulator, cholesterol catabolism regulator